MSETDIFCPNCHRFVGLKDHCDACQRLRPPAAQNADSHARWQTRIDDADSPVDSLVFQGQLSTAQGLVIIPTERGDPAALDAKTGQKRWSRSLHPTHKLRAQAAVPWKDLLLLGLQNMADLPSCHRALVALQTGTGEEAWNWPTPGDSLSVPQVEQDAAYFTTSEPALYALDLASGAELWQYGGDEKLRTGSALLENQVFTGQRDYKIYCLQWQKDEPILEDPKVLLQQDRPLEAAAGLALQGGYIEAASLYYGNGEPRHAAALFIEAGMLRRAADMYVMLGE